MKKNTIIVSVLVGKNNNNKSNVQVAKSAGKYNRSREKTLRRGAPGDVITVTTGIHRVGERRATTVSYGGRHARPPADQIKNL
jgi:hypothetical protein